MTLVPKRCGPGAKVKTTNCFISNGVPSWYLGNEIQENFIFRKMAKNIKNANFKTKMAHLKIGTLVHKL